MKRMLLVVLLLPLMACPPPDDLAGTWDVRSTAVGTLTATLSLNAEGIGSYTDFRNLDARTGTAPTTCATGSVSGSLNGDQVALQFTCQHLTKRIEGTLEGNSVTNSSGQAGWPLTMTRR